MCGALHNANTSHHLHPEIRTQGQAINNNDVEMTAGQRENTGNPSGDVIATRDTGNLSDDASRDAVSDVLSEINDVDNLERAEPCNLKDNKKDIESNIGSRSPYALRSRKK